MNGFSFRKSPGNMSLSSSKIAVQFKEKRIVPVAPQSEDQAPVCIISVEKYFENLIIETNLQLGGGGDDGVRIGTRGLADTCV